MNNNKTCFDCSQSSKINTKQGNKDCCTKRQVIINDQGEYANGISEDSNTTLFAKAGKCKYYKNK